MLTPLRNRAMRRLATPVGAAAALALAMPSASLAEPNPYYVGAGLTVEHDSNVTRVADSDPKVASTIYVGTLVAGINQPIGRQRLFGDARVQSSRFSGYSAYNYTGYALNAGIDWSTIERVSGTLRMGATQSLARYAPDESPTVLAKNIERTQDISGLVRVGVTTPLTLEASADVRSVRYSAREFDRREFDQSGGGLAARYVIGGALTLGAGVRHSEYDYPRAALDLSGQAVGNRLKRDDVDLSATWVATGASSITARLSATRWRNSLDGLADYTGGTGIVTWYWKPTGKISLMTRLSRDSGSETSFIFRSGNAPSNILGLASLLLPDQVDGSTLIDALRVQMDYAATAKIRVNAGVRLQERKLDRSAFPNGFEARDRTNTYSLGATWTPIRPVTVGCDLRRDDRPASSLVSAYSVDTIGCNVQFVIQ